MTKVVALGGGTGLSTMLRGLKHYTDNITAIVTMTDDGGSSGMLRQDLGMLPPGDIRNCLLALADIEPTMEKLFHYRFSDGVLRGQSFGNLFLAAMYGIYGNFEETISRANDVLAVKGRVIPVTGQDVRLCALFEDGSEVFGESKIAEAKSKCGCRIKKVVIVPGSARGAAGVVEAIQEADIILLGPGSLYTSVIPSLLVSDVAKAIKISKAPKVYICNVMTQPGETEGYSAFDHVSAIVEHAGEDILDYCIVNTGRVSDKALERYKEDGSTLVEIDRERFFKAGIELLEADMAEYEKEFVRHNPKLLAFEIANFFSSRSGRERDFFVV